MKTFEVPVEISTRFSMVIEAETEEDAIAYAEENARLEISLCDMEVETGEAKEV